MLSLRSSFAKQVLVLSFVLPIAGCAGTKSGSTTPQTVAIQLNKSTATLAPGGTQQFTATVTGTDNTAVTWTVDNVSGGNSTTGKITSAGLYTAPESSGTHVVTATAVADTTKTASAKVTVSGTVSISPAMATIVANATQQFQAALNGTAISGATWAVDGVNSGNSTVGTISSTGLYTAPAQAGTHTVSASIGTGAENSATAPVAIFTLGVSPAGAAVEESGTQQFTATIQGISNTSVTWSVDGVAGGNAAAGTISATGIYTAPAQLGTHTIAATSAADTGASASATATVFSMSISPDGATLAPGGTQLFTATIYGLTNTSVTWSVDGIAGGNSSVGTVGTSGLYTAPSTTGGHNVTATSVANPSDAVNARVTVINVAPSAVLTYHNDDARDGAYLEEVTLTPSNVNPTQFGKVATYPVDGQIYGQPLYMPQLTINGGTHDVVFVATQNNSLYAFDADATTGNGTTFWKANFGTPANAYDAGGPWPVVGILSTPVIDATSNTIYIVAHVENGNPEYMLHALDVTTGTDRVTPVGISGSVGGDSLGSGCYQRMALTLNPISNMIYAAIGSCPSGWVFAYDKTTLQQTAIFDATPGAGGGGFWASGGAAAIDDSTGDLYFMNGTDAGDQQWIYQQSMDGYNDSFLRMDPNTLAVLDYFAPDDNVFLATNDADLGSGSNVLVPGSATYPHELLGGGKDGYIFVVNRDNMGGYNNQTNNVLQTIQTGTSELNNIFDTPVYWNGLVYFHSNGDVLRAFSWTAGAAAGQQLSATSVANGNAVFGKHGATPSLSANGNTNGIVWDIDNSAYVNTDPITSGPAVLHAYDASNIANELYNSADAGTRDQAGLALKFTVPTIANGRVFVPTGSELDIYGLLNP